MKEKPKLFLKIGEEIKDISSDQNEVVESVYKEIGDYSLTPTNIKGRELQLFTNKPKLDVQKVQYDVNKVLLDNSQKLSFIVHTKQSEQKHLESMINLIQDSLSKDLYLSTKEQSYINDYNLIANEIDLSQIPCSFIDHYEGVVRHGINVHDDTIKIVDLFNKILQKEVIDTYNQQLENNEPKAIDKGSNKGSQKSANKLALDENSFKTLHPLEVFILRNSIIDVIQNKQKAVLIDIFERNKDGTIATEKVQAGSQDIMLGADAYKPKTHTIVLCRKEAITNEDEYNFLVIDPSNSEFSRHLGMTGVNYVINNLLEIEKSVKIEVSPISYKIYEQRKEVGTGCAFNKFRDCIDIAFKLGIKLNALTEENISFSTDEKLSKIFVNILVNDIITSITNNKDYDTNIDKVLCTQKFLDYPFRGKQLTEVEKGKDLYEKQVNTFKAINNAINKLSDPMLISVAQSKVKAEFEAEKLNLESLKELQNTINSTLNFYKETWGIENEIIQSDFQALSGDVNEYFSEYYASI